MNGKKLATIGVAVLAFGGIIANTVYSVVRDNQLQNSMNTLKEDSDSASEAVRLELQKVKQELTNDYKVSADNLEAEMALLEEQVGVALAYLNAVDAEQATQLVAQFNSLKELVAELEARVSGALGDFFVDEGIEVLREQIYEVMALMRDEDLEGSLAWTIAKVNEELNERIDEEVALLNETIEKTKLGLEALVALEREARLTADAALQALVADEKAAREKAIADLEAKLQAVENNLKQTQDDLSDAVKRIAALEASDAQQTQEIDSLKTQLAALSKSLEDAKKELQQAIKDGDAETLAAALKAVSEERDRAEAAEKQLAASLYGLSAALEAEIQTARLAEAKLDARITSFEEALEDLDGISKAVKDLINAGQYGPALVKAINEFHEHKTAKAKAIGCLTLDQEKIEKLPAYYDGLDAEATAAGLALDDPDYVEFKAKFEKYLDREVEYVRQMGEEAITMAANAVDAAKVTTEWVAKMEAFKYEMEYFLYRAKAVKTVGNLPELESAEITYFTNLIKDNSIDFTSIDLSSLEKIEEYYDADALDILKELTDLKLRVDLCVEGAKAYNAVVVQAKESAKNILDLKEQGTVSGEITVAHLEHYTENLSDSTARPYNGTLGNFLNFQNFKKRIDLEKPTNKGKVGDNSSLTIIASTLANTLGNFKLEELRATNWADLGEYQSKQTAEVMTTIENNTTNRTGSDERDEDAKTWMETLVGNSVTFENWNTAVDSDLFDIENTYAQEVVRINSKLRELKNARTVNSEVITKLATTWSDTMDRVNGTEEYLESLYDVRNPLEAAAYTAFMKSIDTDIFNLTKYQNWYGALSDANKNDQTQYNALLRDNITNLNATIFHADNELFMIKEYADTKDYVEIHVTDTSVKTFLIGAMDAMYASFSYIDENGKAKFGTTEISGNVGKTEEFVKYLNEVKDAADLLGTANHTIEVVNQQMKDNRHNFEESIKSWAESLDYNEDAVKTVLDAFDEKMEIIDEQFKVKFPSTPDITGKSLDEIVTALRTFSQGIDVSKIAENVAKHQEALETLREDIKVEVQKEDAKRLANLKVEYATDGTGKVDMMCKYYLDKVTETATEEEVLAAKAAATLCKGSINALESGSVKVKPLYNVAEEAIRLALSIGNDVPLYGED